MKKSLNDGTIDNSEVRISNSKLYHSSFLVKNSSLKLFACDLDNTLIHSYKHRVVGDICIEIYNGREQSFISSRAVDLLRQIIDKVLFIPITTRSIEQYNRIRWLSGTVPDFAVVSNGANLIFEGKLNDIWRRESLTYIQPYEDELQRQYLLLSKNDSFEICRIVDDSFLFIKCRNEIDSDRCAGDIQSHTNLLVRHSGQKIYLFPPLLNKGEALRKLQNKLSPVHTFCAGDSDIDIPMLKLAGTAYAPSSLSPKLESKCHQVFQSTEDILMDILRYVIPD